MEDAAKSGCDRICARFVFTGPGTTLDAQAAFVLENVVPKLVR